MGSSSYEKNQQEQSKASMDILQQSLQAADILSGEDFFGELGLNFNNSSTDAVELPNELEALASQADSLYNTGEIQTTNHSNFMDYTSTTNNLPASPQFDTSQFLNTSAPVNVGIHPHQPTPELQNQNYVEQKNVQVADPASSVTGMYQPFARSSSPEVSTSKYLYEHQDRTAFIQSQTGLHSGAQLSVQSSIQENSASPVANDAYLVSTMSVTQALTVTTCNSVFSKVPTQTVSSTSQMNYTVTSDSNHNMLPAGIRVVSQHAYQAASLTPDKKLQMSNTHAVSPTTVRGTTNFQIVQQPNTANPRNTRQLITVVQKPGVSLPANQNQTTNQLLNGLAVQQQQANLLGQNRGVAVLRVAGSKHNINLSDPQVVKALTANLVQKQQVEVQSSQQQPQQQFIKLGQNNAFINVASQRSQQQVVQKAQQITLQNGQTILLNNGQQVQLCNPQTQPAQVQVLQQSSMAQNIPTVKDNNAQILRNSQQPARNSQLPIKGIQIASVNIPVGSSTNTTSLNISPIQSNVVTIPVVAKQDLSRNSVSATDNLSVRPVATSQNSHVVQVKNLLANSLLKQNANNSSSPAASQQARSVASSQAIAVNGQGANPTGLQRAQLGTTLRLNLTPQQASQLTNSQLQTILKQHQAVLQARALVNTDASSGPEDVTQQQNTAAIVEMQKPAQKNKGPNSLAAILRPSSTNSVTPVGNTVVVNKTPAVDNSSVRVFRIDPTLTEEKAEEVKKLLANRTTGVKLSSLTQEQQQLVMAFQAQIRAMSPPVQQYYLRNPQLFMQKVMQQIRAGKPYILQVKMDVQQNKAKVVASTPSVNKPHHPTISLTQEPGRAKRANTPTLVTPTQSRSASPAARSASPIIRKPIVIPTPNATVTVQVPRRVIKRPVSEPQNVSLVLEQLGCHKKMAANPDCIQPFVSVRDGIRRLVPFHTCNIPDIKEKDFEESERIFDHISDSITARTRAMVNKYHLLCLRDSTRDSCSAEMVMIERMFLQKEKAKLADDKARIKENPAVIKEYFPDRYEESEAVVINSDDDDDVENQVTEHENPWGNDQQGAYLDDETELDASSRIHSMSEDSPLSNSYLSIHSRTNVVGHEPRTLLDGRSYSHDDSFSSPGGVKRLKTESVDSFSQGSSDELLLQEAVDSILCE